MEMTETVSLSPPPHAGAALLLAPPPRAAPELGGVKEGILEATRDMVRRLVMEEAFGVRPRRVGAGLRCWWPEVRREEAERTLASLAAPSAMARWCCW